MSRRDYTTEAEAMFKSFAERHGLGYVADAAAPVELLWTFPEQPKLSMPITLGLQNSDELNFGASDFWSYFFPFDDVADRFEVIIDAWVAGEARIAVTGRRSRFLQVRKGEQWETVYGAGGCLFPFRRAPRSFIANDPKT